MIYDWRDIPQVSEELVGERAWLLAGTLPIGLPMPQGFCLSWTFLDALMQQHGLKEAFLDLTTNPGNSIETTRQQMKRIFLDLSARFTLQDAPIVRLLEKLNAMPKEPLQLAPSLSAYCADFTQPLPDIKPPFEHALQPLLLSWNEAWTDELLETVIKKNLNPFKSLGGLIIHVKPKARLSGTVTSCDLQHFSPFDMQLSAMPPESRNADKRGSRYHLARNPLQQDIQIRREIHAQITPGASALRLRKEQIKGLGAMTARAWQHLGRHITLHWTLDEDHLQVTGVSRLHSAASYFPFKDNQLQLNADEQQQVEDPSVKPGWILDSNHPFTPLGMSFDHLITRTLNQGILSCKLPLPLYMVRYINGFRYRTAYDPQHGLIERFKNQIRKKNFEQFQQEFLETQAPKYLELLKVTAQQDLRKASLKEEQQIIEHALRIIMRFVAESSELRCLMILREEESSDAITESPPQITSLIERLRKESLLDAARQSAHWNEFIPHLLSRPNGEQLLNDVVRGDRDAGALWLNSEPVDPSGEEDPSLLFLHLKQALTRPSPNGTPPSTTLTLKRWEGFVIQGARTLNRIFLNTGIKLKNAKMLTTEHDIFFITFDELLSLFSQTKLPADFRRTLEQLVNERKRAFAGWRELYPPATLPVAPLSAMQPWHEQTLSGKTLVPGKSKGTARLIRNTWDLSRSVPGDILVFSRFRDEWAGFVAQAAGLVFDHQPISATLRRTLSATKTPVVVEVRDIFQHLQNGNIVAIDAIAAGAGTLQVLSP